MADPAHHALLDTPRIWAAAQHLEIMVRFDHQHVTTAQVIANAGGHVAQVRADTDFDAVAPEGESHRVLGVMRDGERPRSEEHTSELQSLRHLVCRLLL